MTGGDEPMMGKQKTKRFGQEPHFFLSTDSYVASSTIAVQPNAWVFPAESSLHTHRHVPNQHMTGEIIGCFYECGDCGFRNQRSDLPRTVSHTRMPLSHNDANVDHHNGLGITFLPCRCICVQTEQASHPFQSERVTTIVRDRAMTA